jgi:glycosyltransferase involved in cell wall biosynthesis
MKIIYLYRNPQSGFSIGRVFETISAEVSKICEAENVYMPCKNANPLAVLKNVLYAKKTIKKNKSAIFHITGDIHYLCWFLPRKNLIVTVHDLWFYAIINQKIKKYFTYLLWVLPLKRAKKVVFISDTTKKQTLEYVSLKPEQMSIIFDPVSSDYKKTYKIFNKEKPVILQVGTGSNKNLKNLIPALNGIKCHLRLVGVLKEEYMQLLEKHNIEYSNISKLDDKQVVDEYKNCDIVNLISEHEGFGMPIIEAQASNKPVITSAIPPMNEIAGEGAAVVNPYNQQEIHDTYKKLIEDTNYRETVRKKGYENVKRFHVKEITKQYMAIYHSITKNKTN